MNNFEYYLEKGEVRRASMDIALARSLIESADSRIKFILRQEVDQDSATIIHEQVYDALRELLDSILALEGYKSYSHIASSVYLRKFSEFNDTELNRLDTARKRRNDSKYYGKQTTIQETEDIISFYRAIRPKLDKRINVLLKG